MRVLLLASADNSMSQRFRVELRELGHEVSFALATSDEAMVEAVTTHRPDLVVCPLLKKILPERVWRSRPCIIVHPGILGDRGRSSLDWAIQERETEWGVTLLEANGEIDAGDVWSSCPFPTRAASKSALYRDEVRGAAVGALRETLFGMRAGFSPQRVDSRDPSVRGRLRPPMRQEDRRIDWSVDDTETVLAKIRAADGSPGVLDAMRGGAFHLFGAHREGRLHGNPGALVARRHGAVCRATVDGAVWITHLKRVEPGTLHAKLPAVLVLGADAMNLPEVPAGSAGDDATFREIRYEEIGDVGVLHFDFYNGAMSTEQARRLRAAYRQVQSRPTRVLVLFGGRTFWSTGIYLHRIEAARHPGQEAWTNLEAIDDVVKEIVETDTKLVVSALRGDAAAGGVALALAADLVFARPDLVLNPSYRSMGELYGSEYWTYLLPKRVGAARAEELSRSCRPVGTGEAARIGLVDDAFGDDDAQFRAMVLARAEALARRADLPARLARKIDERRRDETKKPLAAYRAEELAVCRRNFFDEHAPFHEARRRFVYKIAAPPPAVREEERISA